MDEWVKKMCVHAMEYCSDFRKKEILPLGMAEMDLEDVMLSKIRQTQKDKYGMISLT